MMSDVDSGRGGIDRAVRMPAARLFPLFLVCFAAIGYEIAKNRVSPIS